MRMKNGSQCQSHNARSHRPVPEKGEIERGRGSGKSDRGLCTPTPAQEATANLSNLDRAMRACCKGVLWKASVSSYKHNALRRLLKLRKDILTGKYKPSKGARFVIHEPKTRDIVATIFKDRVPQRSLYDNYLYQEVCERFHPWNCACQREKGTDYARNLLKSMLRQSFDKSGMGGWVLKMDVKSFFASIRHDIAKEVMRERIGDPFALQMVFDVIDQAGDGIGLDLGSQLNQIVALSMLDDLDKTLSKLNVLWVRYMDDIIVLGDSKEQLKTILAVATAELEMKSLRFSPKKTMIAPIRQPIRFLGFSFLLHPTGRVTKKPLPENVARRRRKMRRQKNLVLKGVLTKEDFIQFYKSGRDHFKKGTRSTLNKMDGFFKKMMEEITMNEELIRLRQQVEELTAKVFDLEAEVAKLKMEAEEDKDAE